MGFLACAGGAKELITQGELREHVEFLASDETRGRFIGTDGIESVEAYIAGQFQRYGLSRLPGEEDFFLEFSLHSQSIDRRRTTIEVLEAGKPVSGTIGKDFRPFPFSSFDEKTAELVFAGYGITAREYGYDDYEDLDVDGKIVLIMRHEPEENQEDGKFEGGRHSSHALFRNKAENALKHGAVGMLLYTDPLHHPDNDDLRVRPVLSFDLPQSGPVARREIDDENGFVAFHVSQSFAGLLMGKDRAQLKDLQRRIDFGFGVAEAAAELGDLSTVKLRQISEADIGSIQVRNVAAIAMGSDDLLKDEWIVIGAHHDHLGSYPGEGDTIFNGADDNASGVSGLLELAEQIADVKLRRSIVFVTFTAEEEGLFGSYALERFNLIDISKVKLMINFDMIGRNPEDDIMVYGDGFSPEIRQILEKTNRRYKFSFAYMNKTYEPFSDIAVFHENQIPYLMFFTGEHQDYHTTQDHAETLSYQRMETLMRFSYDVVTELAGGAVMPEFRR